MEENKQTEVINIKEIIRKIWNKRKLYCKVLAATFVLSCIYILGIPRYYSTDTRLAPEMGNASGGALGSLASSFGFDIGGIETTDAIYPSLYPDLMDDNGFVASLFNIKVVSQDGEINATYHDYLQKHQKKNVWSYPISWIKSLFKSKKTGNGGQPGEFNPYYLSETEDHVAEAIRKNVRFNFNEKTGVITITTKAQDPLICKTLADSVKERLQDFITSYRTNKARVDYEYYKELANKAKQDYEKIRQKYASMSDANTKVALKSVELRMEDMENEMQLKFNAYTTINNQLEAAKAKVQERTPAFTLLKGAAVPMRPAGPKRMLFVLFMLILASMATITYILREDILKIIAIKGK